MRHFMEDHPPKRWAVFWTARFKLPPQHTFGRYMVAEFDSYEDAAAYIAGNDPEDWEIEDRKVH